MKLMIVAVGLLCLQILSSGCTASLDITPEMIEHMIDSRWECSYCGNSNGEWTSLCGKCGRYRPR